MGVGSHLLLPIFFAGLQPPHSAVDGKRIEKPINRDARGRQQNVGGVVGGGRELPPPIDQQRRAHTTISEKIEFFRKIFSGRELSILNSGYKLKIGSNIESRNDVIFFSNSYFLLRSESTIGTRSDV